MHRGVYTIADESTRAYEAARAKLARFVNARETEEIVFVRNGTEAINLVAYTWGRQNLAEGDVVVLSEMEHHANVVPWLMLAEERGIELRWIPLTADFRLDLTSIGELLRGAKLLAITAMSNVLGTINDIGPLARAAHAAGATRARRRVPGRAAPPRRRAGLGRRLRRDHRRTRCSARPASARCGPARSCSRRCRRSSAAAR